MMTRRESLRAQLTRRLPLLPDDQIGSLTTEIENTLCMAFVCRADTANYASWLGVAEPAQPSKKHRGIAWRAAHWLGFMPDDVPEISDEIREARRADCVAYTERSFAEQTFDLRAAVTALAPDADAWQLAAVCQEIWATYTAALDTNRQASRADQSAMLRWIAGVRARGLSSRVSEPQVGDTSAALASGRFWAGEALPTPAADMPAWEPAGDGLESVRIHPAVAQTIDHWFMAHPAAAPNPSGVVGSPAAAQAAGMTKHLRAAEGLVHDAYRVAFAPSRAVVPAPQLRTFVRWWLALAGICLSLTAATGVGTWRRIAFFVGPPTAMSTFTWAVTIALTVAGFLLASSAVSVGLGLVWSRYLSRIRFRTIRVALCLGLWCLLIWLTPHAVRLWLLIDPSDYLGIQTWWGRAAMPIASSIVMVLLVNCFIDAAGLADDWNRITHKPLSLSEALGQAREVLCSTAVLLEHMPPQGTFWEVFEPVQVRVDHLADLMNQISATMPRLGTSLIN